MPLAKLEMQSVSISQCGTFALIGSAGGRIDMFNLQSGLHQQSFPPLLSVPKANPRNIHGSVTSSADDKGGHTRAVTGLMVDGLNRTVISCGLDGKVKVSFLAPPSWKSETNGIAFLEFSFGILFPGSLLASSTGIQ